MEWSFVKESVQRLDANQESVNPITLPPKSPKPNSDNEVHDPKSQEPKIDGDETNFSRPKAPSTNLSTWSIIDHTLPKSDDKEDPDWLQLKGRNIE